MPGWYVWLEDYVSKFLLAAITVLVLIAAVTRSVGHPVIWSDDMAQLLFVWLCVFGAVRAMRLKAHMAVDYAVKWMPRTPRWLLELFNAAIILAFLLTLAFSGYKLTMLNWQRIYGDSGISYAWVTIAIPAGCFLMSLEIIIHTFRSFRDRSFIFFPEKPNELERAHSQLG
ncbi:MAG: TRAP transporter small permease [Beijerinckiaceae bacterium]|nr:TRAP transporter small permease [Beijerinckiaceae bacterium]